VLVDPLNPQRILSGLLVVALEVSLIAVIVGVLYVAATVVLSRLAARNRSRTAWISAARVRTRRLLVSALFLLIAGVLVVNAGLLVWGVDLQSSVLDPIVSVTAERRSAMVAALGKLVLAAVALFVLTRPLRRIFAAAETAINRWGQLKANSESLARFFRGSTASS